MERVDRLGIEWFDEVVDTLCDAFHDYPVMRYVLKDSGSEYDAHLRQLVGYFTDSRFSRGWPVLGIVEDGRLVGAANVTPTRRQPSPPSLQRRYERLTESIGQIAIDRFVAFQRSGEPFETKMPHYYLGMIGVRRRDQGHGHARSLLESVHELSRDDEESIGVALTTESPDNLPFYEHFGYRIVGRAEVEELESWTLFRDDTDC